MSFAPNLFLANVRGKDGLAKPSRFEVILPIPEYINKFVSTSIIEKILNLPNSVFSDVSEAINVALGGKGNDYQKNSNPAVSRYLALQCETAEFPGKQMMTQDVRIYGPSFKVPYLTQYEPITLTFLCTNTFYERKLFDRWMESINPTDTNNFRYPKDINTRYLTNIKIIQFDDFVRQIFAVELIDAFPIAISPQTLNWSEDGFHRLSIQFAYFNYVPIYEGTYDLGNTLTSILGSVATRFWPVGTAPSG